ncbi:MAG: hypothetical protein K2Q10_05105 [Rhodospirillales bacterium]|nr:hypothetical protein [Rhodospirillales bacterium]
MHKDKEAATCQHITTKAALVAVAVGLQIGVSVPVSVVGPMFECISFASADNATPHSTETGAYLDTLTEEIPRCQTLLADPVALSNCTAFNSATPAALDAKTSHFPIATDLAEDRPSQIVPVADVPRCVSDQ